MDKQKYLEFKKEDEQLIKEIESMEFEPSKDTKKIVAQLKEAATNYDRKDKTINIRISNQTLDKIKIKASKMGLPYQSLISSILYQVANKKIKFEI